MTLAASTLALLLALMTPPSDTDWAQWGGPRRDFTTTAHLPAAWPDGGPRLAWERPLGEGYSGIAVSDGALYTMVRRGAREVVVSLRADTGAPRWEHAYEAPFSSEYSMEHGEGPHATPLVTGGRVFAVGATGPCGAIPWYTRRLTVDMWGLNDAHIARRIMPDMGHGSPGHEKGDGAYVLGRQPDVILFTAARFTPRPIDAALLDTGWLSVSERELLDLPEFERRYAWRSVRLGSTWFNYFTRVPSGPA